MNKLEEFIQANASQLDTALPPSGAEEQFLERWEAAEKGRKKRIFYFAFSAAAAVAVILALLPWKSAGFRGLGNNPDAVYEHYLAVVADAWEVAAYDEEAAAMLESLTNEAIPLRDLLPDELSPREQAAILRAHYGDLLEGVDKIMKSVKR
jgi:hypothetical protein